MGRDQNRAELPIGLRVALLLVATVVGASVATGQGTIPADQPVWDQVTTRVSVDPAGADGDDGSELWGNQAISGDGRFVVFRSYATNLVAGDTNRMPDAFLRDRLTGETTRVSVSSDGRQPNGRSGDPCVSLDGRYVAFDSYATNLVSDDRNGACDVFVHDRLTGETTRVSVDSWGGEGNYLSGRPSISGDGRYVAFKSLATNLVRDDMNGWTDVFVHDRVTGETTRVSVSSDGTEGDRESGHPFAPWISADGRYVAFPSDATNLVACDRNGYTDVFVHDRHAKETTRVSVSSSGAEANQASWYPALSSDGRYVAFLSGASNLVPGDANDLLDVFAHDRATGETTRVSVSSTGAEGDFDSRDPAISGDGRYVAFTSAANNLAPGARKGSDIFVHDRATRKTTCTSPNFAGIRGFNYVDCVYPSISADGRYVAFTALGTGLVPGDTNESYDVFVRGPEITLEADPGAVVPGQLLRLTEYKGVPGNAVSLWLVRVNGSRTLALLAAGSFAGDGNFLVSGLVPPGLSGESITFRGYAVGQAGLQVRTNDVTVSFR
ncbi:MAG: calcium-binding protein [Planctomycetota bacterium]